MSEEYIGIISNYRLGNKTQRNKECLIKVLKEEASESNMLMGWNVSWPLEEPKIRGKIVCPHGRTGTLRVKFSRGLPGQAMSTRVKIYKED